MRIPSDKHIRLECSECSEKLEYDNGILVSAVEVVNTLSDTRTTVNRSGTSRKTSFWGHYVFYSLIIVVVVIFMRNTSCNISENTNEPEVTVDSVSSIATEIPLTADSSTQHSQLFNAAYPEDDSARKSLIEDALDKINDAQDILDVVKDIAELLMSDETDNNHTRARADYQYWNDYFRDRGGKYEAAWKNSKERQAIEERINQISKETCGCPLV